jgi:4a-hydroxytetrahydrobiopterin dehydratase
MNLAELAALHCEPRKGKEHALDEARVRTLLAPLPEWQLALDGKSIAKTFHFRNLEVGYNRCVVRWSTHDVGGLSMNDFICAARVETIAHA